MLEDLEKEQEYAEAENGKRKRATPNQVEADRLSTLNSSGSE